MANAASPKALQAPFVCLKGVSRYIIQHRSVGHTYEKIFIDYIDAHLTELTIEDPYLLEARQGRN